MRDESKRQLKMGDFTKLVRQTSGLLESMSEMEGLPQAFRDNSPAPPAPSCAARSFTGKAKQLKFQTT